MRELHITMLGPRYTGKTSLLTSMFYEYQREIAKTTVQLTPDPKTAAILGRKLSELKSLNDALEEGGIQPTAAKGDTSSIRSFIFDVGKKGNKPALKLHFWDYPGEYVISEDNPEQQEFVTKRMQESVAVLVPIDAPALMEKRGDWNEYRNQPLAVTACFQRAYQDLKIPRLVILAPIKCESYLQDFNTTKELIYRIKVEYESLLDLLSSESLVDRVAVVITPVQTVGTILFSRIKTNDGIPKFIFKKQDPDAEYSPKDNEQPLKYLLRFLLKVYLDDRFLLFKIFSNLFRLDDYLKEAIREFSKDCKTIDGFEVIQGQELLKVD